MELENLSNQLQQAVSDAQRNPKRVDEPVDMPNYDAPQPTQQTQEPYRSTEAENVKNLRAKIDALEARNNMLERERKKNKKKLDNDAFVSGDDYNRHEDELLELRNQVSEQNEFIARQKVFAELQKKYKDFSRVVSDENMARLEQENPDVFEAINSARSLKSSGTVAYTAIKQMLGHGYQADDEDDDYESNYNSKRLQENMRKPQNPSRGAQHQVSSNPNRFTEEDKRAHWELVERIMNG